MTDKSHLHVGVYVDAANLEQNGGFGMQYDVLREFACRDQAEPLRLNAYVTYDEERGRTDTAYKRKINSFHHVLRDYGYKVLQKNIRWYTDPDTGKRYGKANADLDLAVDALLQAKNLDRVIIATGDGDFTNVILALQNKGCRVEVIGFDNVSAELRREADLYTSGYVIPNLLPVRGNDNLRWGEIGSRVRGYCYYFDEQRGYGFFRFLKHISPDIWITDTRLANSPYAIAFFHASDLPPEADTNRLPSRSAIFEFQLEPAENGSNRAARALDIRLVSPKVSLHPPAERNGERKSPPANHEA